MPITLDGTNGITQADQFNSDSTFGFKNRIINGAMVIDQRNAGASVTPADGAYTLDRWVYLADQASKCTIQQNAGSVTPPVGFSNYLGVTSTAATTITTSQQFSVIQRVEGFNMLGLNWGSANAQTVTLSFWVCSSLTGTFGGVLRNDAGDYNYPFSYTISSANTWEQKSVTITGATTGTWTINNGRCLQVAFSLGAGATLSGTAGAWTSSNFWSVTGATQVLATNGATFYITGVQLEVGSTATSFDYRPYGTELALCQRYYWETSKGLGGSVASSTTAVLVGRNPVTMRATPTLSGNAIEVFQLTVAGSKTQSSFNANTTISDPNSFALECGNFTSLTQYYPVGMNSGKITFSSEL